MKLCQHDECAKVSETIYEKKDACYTKVKSRYDVWPSAYASGALVKCRKVGAKNWGNKSKKEGVTEEILKEDIQDLKKIVKELEGASKMHAGQAKRIQSHLDDMNVKEELLDESLLKQIKQAEKIAKSMSGNMTGAVKGIEKIRRGLSHHKRVKVALKKYNESVNESISVFDVDFYKDNSSEQTSHEEIIRGDKFSDVISKTTKVAKSKKMNYVELYYKGAFIGSIDKRNSFKFKKGRNHQKSPLSVNEGQKKQASVILRKFDMAYIKFSQEVRDVMKLMDKSTGSKVDGKIIEKAYGKHLIPFDDLMQSWAKGQQENPGLSEDD